MRILIGQPIHENGITQLENELCNNPSIDAVLFPEGYIASEELVDDACQLAQKYGVAIITGYRDQNRKDRALFIAKSGEVILERAKTPMDVNLYSPSDVEFNGKRFGYLLCVELLQGFVGFQELGIQELDFVAHPVGVGMFSEEQFEEWIAEAKRIAVEYQTMVIGTSHADGSFKNCGVSIPIAYCINRDGEPIFVSKNDVRTVILDTERKAVEFIQCMW